MGVRKFFKATHSLHFRKFSQRNNLGQTSFFSNANRYFKLILDDSKAITNITKVNYDTLLLTYTHKAEFVTETSMTNVMLASFITSLARLKLYEVIEKVAACVSFVLVDLTVHLQPYARYLYCDTDSLVFAMKIGKPLPIETGDILGQLGNEYPNKKIPAYFSCGPKVRLWCHTHFAFLAVRPENGGP
jgi:hypothetical protein